MAIGAEHINFRPDAHMLIALGANGLDPDRTARAMVVLGHGPRTGQRIVDRRDFVVKGVRIGLVEKDALLDDGFVVRVERYAAGVESAGAFEVASLDLEDGVTAAALLIDPFAD